MFGNFKSSSKSSPAVHTSDKLFRYKQYKHTLSVVVVVCFTVAERVA